MPSRTDSNFPEDDNSTVPKAQRRISCETDISPLLEAPNSPGKDSKEGTPKKVVSSQQGDEEVADNQSQKSDKEITIRPPMNLSELPILCISKIFESLNIQEKFEALPVCKSWREAVYLWCKTNTTLYLFDNNSMMRDYVYRKSHLYNIDCDCEHHHERHRCSIIPNINDTVNESHKWIHHFSSITILCIASPWYFSRELYLRSWKLESLTIYTEKQAPEDLEKLFKTIDKIKTLKKLILYNTGSCQYFPEYFQQICKRLNCFGIFEYKHNNIDDILKALPRNITSLIFDNVRLLTIPLLPQLKCFTYGWTDRSEDSTSSWQVLLREIPQKFPTLQSLAYVTKCGLEIIEQIQGSAISEMEPLTDLKLYIHYERNCSNNPSLSKLTHENKFITSLHIYFMPTIKVQNDFCHFIFAFFPQLKSFHIHSPNHPFSSKEITCLRSEFQHIDFQLFRHPIS